MYPSGNQTPSLCVFEKSPHWHNKRHLYCSLHLGNSKGFRGCEPGTTYEKDILVISMSKYLFLINHSITYPTGNQGSRHHQMLKASNQLKHVPKGSRVPRHMNGLLSGRRRDQLAVQQVMIRRESILWASHCDSAALQYCHLTHWWCPNFSVHFLKTGVQLLSSIVSFCYTIEWIGYCCSVTKSCPTLCPMDLSLPAFSVLHYLLEFAQIHHWVSDAV